MRGDRLPRALALVVALVLGGACVAALTYEGRGATAGSPPIGSGPAGSGTPGPGSGETGSGMPGSGVAGSDVVAPSVESTARVTGRAESLVVSARFDGLDRIELAGPLEVTLEGVLVDAAGTEHPTGSTGIEIGADALVVEAPPEALTLGAPFIRFDTTGAVVGNWLPDSRPSARATITSDVEVTVSASGVVAGRRAEGVVFPVTLTGSIGYSARDVVWRDPPTALRAEVGWLTWAGTGAVEFRGTRHEHRYLGTRGNGILDLTGPPGAIALAGEVDVESIWVDGAPALPTTATVEVEPPDRMVTAGRETRFTWAPTNRGAFDLTMTRISPTNAEGAWVELALDPLPRMYGGEDREARGGVTDGLVYDSGGFLRPRTAPISSLLRPGTADSRSISIHVPRCTPPGPRTVELIVEGNVDPVVVRVPFEVVADPEVAC